MPKGKKREATPKRPKVSPAVVDAPPAPLKKAVVAQLGECTGAKARGEVVDSTSTASPNRNKSTPAIQDSRRELDKRDIPEELAQVEDSRVIAAFHELNPRQQQFLLHYLRQWNATEAYRTAYNLLPTDDWAEVNGSQLLRNTKIKAVLTAFQDFRDEDITLIRKTYIAAAKDAIKPIYGKDSDGQPEKIEDLPDHMTRISAAEKLARLHGANAPAEVKATHTIQSMTDEQLDAKIAQALLQAGASAPAGGEGQAKAHAQD